MKIPVLYIHHTGVFGGASRSLLELITAFPPGSVSARLITPRGNVARFFGNSGVETLEVSGISQFDNTRYGYYRGMRWLILLRELWFLVPTIAAIVRSKRHWPDTEIIHVNEAVVPVAVILAKTVFRKPVIVHVRSIQDARSGRLRVRIFRYVLQRYADAIIAIDETVGRSLPPGMLCEIIHNAYSPEANSSAADATTPLPPRRAGIMRVAMVGNLLPLKGVYEFLEAARLCSERGLVVEFVLVGGNTRKLSGVTKWLLEVTGFARDMEQEVARFVAHHKLEQIVRLVGFTPRVDQVYENIDVLCFPSHLNAVGRPVYEAAFWKVPSIVAISDPAPDSIVHGETGLCIPPRDPVALADAITYLYAHPTERQRMGDAAYRLATANFNAHKNAERVLALYQRVLARHPTNG